MYARNRTARMADEFTQITEPLQREGMSAEQSTLTAVEQQANLTARYYLTLIKLDIKPAHALDLTHHWLDLCNGVEGEDDDE
jgi:hypothetical protein